MIKKHTDQQFKIGDQVLLNVQNINMKHVGYHKRKLGSKFIGPFSVMDIKHQRTYKLDIPFSLRLHPWFHTSLLKPYYFDPNAERENKIPPVILEDGTEGYIVEKILKKRTKRKKIEYLVKWLGYKDPTWDPEANVNHLADELNAFHSKS